MGPETVIHHNLLFNNIMIRREIIQNHSIPKSFSYSADNFSIGAIIIYLLTRK
jgi:hypothetical protein